MRLLYLAVVGLPASTLAGTEASAIAGHEGCIPYGPCLDPTPPAAATWAGVAPEERAEGLRVSVLGHGVCVYNLVCLEPVLYPEARVG